VERRTVGRATVELELGLGLGLGSCGRRRK